MKFTISASLALMIIVYPTLSVAYTDHYNCKITDLAETWHDAETAELLLDRYKSDEILVDRNTGKVWHFGLGNHSFDQRELIYKGDSQNSFKVMSHSNNGWASHYMTIQEYVETEEKRFILLDGSDVWIGMCR